MKLATLYSFLWFICFATTSVLNCVDFPNRTTKLILYFILMGGAIIFIVLGAIERKKDPDVKIDRNTKILVFALAISYLSIMILLWAYGGKPL